MSSGEDVAVTVLLVPLFNTFDHLLLAAVEPFILDALTFAHCPESAAAISLPLYRFVLLDNFIMIHFVEVVKFLVFFDHYLFNVP
jgi:hypothetical protein